MVMRVEKDGNVDTVVVEEVRTVTNQERWTYESIISRLAGLAGERASLDEEYLRRKSALNAEESKFLQMKAALDAVRPLT